jgi:H/ACA ribonucleoprotein complex non-core subunit NAF1
MNDFKLPQTIPQDLLLIRNLIGVPSDAPPLNPRFPRAVRAADSDNIDSSDSEIASEDEIEAELILFNSEEELRGTKAVHVSLSSTFYSAYRFSSSLSPDSDSDSESESSVNDDDVKSVSNHCLEEEDESGPAQTTGVHFRTKNEVDETDITIPDIAEVGPEEVFEKVGEIMSVMEKLVIVKGVPSERVNQGSERALDSDTLLVFGDRKVMGYVSIVRTFCCTSLRRICRSMKHLAPLPNPCIK